MQGLAVEEALEVGNTDISKYFIEMFKKCWNFYPK
jgi:hypothetical protein